MTVEGGQPALPVDPQASLRTEMVGQLAAAQLALEAAIAELGRSGGDSTSLAAGRLQLTSLISLRQQIGTASGSVLADLRAEVSAAAASGTALVQQARAAATDAASRTTADLAQAARDQVNATMRGMKDFDPYLRFASQEEEAAYRKREAERLAYIAAEQAKETPQGDLNAANAAIDQLKDAKTHGADKSPQFSDRLAGLTKARDELAAALPPTASRANEPANRGPEKSAMAPATEAASSNALDAALAALRDSGVMHGEQAAASNARVGPPKNATLGRA